MKLQPVLRSAFVAHCRRVEIIFLTALFIFIGWWDFRSKKFAGLQINAACKILGRLQKLDLAFALRDSNVRKIQEIGRGIVEIGTSLNEQGLIDYGNFLIDQATYLVMTRFNQEFGASH